MTLAAENRHVYHGEHGPLGLRTDVYVMDHGQLETLVRNTFAGSRDTDFQPEEFWDAITRTSGGDYCLFFATLHEECDPHQDTHIAYTIDPLYRTRLEHVLLAILNECQSIIGEPEDTHQQLARNAIRTVEHLSGIDIVGQDGALHHPKYQHLIDHAQHIALDGRYAGHLVTTNTDEEHTR